MNCFHDSVLRAFLVRVRALTNPNVPYTNSAFTNNRITVFYLIDFPSASSQHYRHQSPMPSFRLALGDTATAARNRGVAVPPCTSRVAMLTSAPHSLSIHRWRGKCTPAPRGAQDSSGGEE